MRILKSHVLKSALFRYILTAQHGHRIAVIMNEVSQLVNLDVIQSFASYKLTEAQFADSADIECMYLALAL